MSALRDGRAPGLDRRASSLRQPAPGTGRLDEAAALFARPKGSGEPEGALQLGIVLERQGKVEQASALPGAMRRDPAWPDPHNNRGVALLHAGRVEERDGVRGTLRLHPGDVEAELNLG